MESHLKFPSQHVKARVSRRSRLVDRILNLCEGDRRVDGSYVHCGGAKRAMDMLQSGDRGSAVQRDHEVQVGSDGFTGRGLLPYLSFVPAKVGYHERRTAGNVEESLAGCMDSESPDVNCDPPA